MADLHYKTKEAAVNKYGPLFAQGDGEVAVREAIAKDEKNFTAEQIDEIYAAIVDANSDPDEGNNNPDTGANSNEGDQSKTSNLQVQSNVEAGAKHVVTKDFRDIKNFDVMYTVGQDVSDLASDRLAELIRLELVKQQ